MLIAFRPIVDGRFLFWTIDQTIDYGPQSIVHGQIMEVRMLDNLNEIAKTALESLNTVHDPAALEAWRVANVGRSSPLMQVFAELGKLSKEERPTVGAAANRVKVTLEAALTERAEAIKAAMLAKSLEEDQLDVTLPGREVQMGRLHPSTQQLRRVLD
ncbi:MAG TPA: hypothetical protein VFH34_05345, partial [Anaerolineales bacterium]|nr:hypothetical protein [Anaerolineales bacterium]